MFTGTGYNIGLLGNNTTQNLMQQYLANLFMRRYNPPAVNGSGVTSQMGQGGMTYRAPTVMQAGLLNPVQQPNYYAQTNPAWNNYGYL